MTRKLLCTQKIVEKQPLTNRQLAAFCPLSLGVAIVKSNKFFV